MSCPDGAQHNTKQHQHVDGQIDDAADWGRNVKVKAESESSGVLRCKCGAFMSRNYACKRCEKLQQGFQAMGFDEVTARRFTDAIAKAPDQQARTKLAQDLLTQAGKAEMAGMAPLIITHFYEGEGVPDDAESSHANGNGVAHTAVNGTNTNDTAKNDDEKIYQAARDRFITLVGSDALDNDDNLAPGYESLQHTPLYQQFRESRTAYRAVTGQDDDPEVAEGEMRDGRFTIPKQLRDSLGGTGLTPSQVGELSRRFRGIGLESAHRQNERIKQEIQRILEEEGASHLTDNVNDVMTGARRRRQPQVKGKQTKRKRRPVSAATREKLRQAAKMRKRCPQCGAFMGVTACRRCAALQGVFTDAGLEAYRAERIADRITAVTKRIEADYRGRNQRLMNQEAQEYLAEIKRGDLILDVTDAVNRHIGRETFAQEIVDKVDSRLNQMQAEGELSPDAIDMQKSPVYGMTNAEIQDTLTEVEADRENTLSAIRGNLAQQEQANQLLQGSNLNEDQQRTIRGQLERLQTEFSELTEAMRQLNGEYQVLGEVANHTRPAHLMSKEVWVNLSDGFKTEPGKPKTLTKFYYQPDSIIGKLAARYGESAPFVAWPSQSRQRVIALQHELEVKTAVLTGESVPDIILDDYPHLRDLQRIEPVEDLRQAMTGWVQQINAGELDGRTVFATQSMNVQTLAEDLAGGKNAPNPHFVKQTETNFTIGVAVLTVANPPKAFATGSSQPITPPGSPEATADSTSVPDTRIKHEVEHERKYADKPGWTWVRFPEWERNPDLETEAYQQAAKESLKQNFGARWGRKRRAWYIRREVPAEDVTRVIAQAETETTTRLGSPAPESPDTAPAPDKAKAQLAPLPSDAKVVTQGEIQHGDYFRHNGRAYEIIRIAETTNAIHVRDVSTATESITAWTGGIEQFQKDTGLTLASHHMTSANRINVTTGHYFQIEDGIHRVMAINRGQDSQTHMVTEEWMPGSRFRRHDWDADTFQKTHVLSVDGVQAQTTWNEADKKRVQLFLESATKAGLSPDEASHLAGALRTQVMVHPDGGSRADSAYYALRRIKEKGITSADSWQTIMLAAADYADPDRPAVALRQKLRQTGLKEQAINVLINAAQQSEALAGGKSSDEIDGYLKNHAMSDEARAEAHSALRDYAQTRNPGKVSAGLFSKEPGPGQIRCPRCGKFAAASGCNHCGATQTAVLTEAYARWSHETNLTSGSVYTDDPDTARAEGYEVRHDPEGDVYRISNLETERDVARNQVPTSPKAQEIAQRVIEQGSTTLPLDEIVQPTLRERAQIGRRKPMQVSIEGLLERHDLLDRLYKNPDFYAKFENEPWQTLTIERLGDERVAVTHWGKYDDGKIYTDTEIVYRLPDWMPVEMTQLPVVIGGRQVGGGWQPIFLEDGRYYPNRLKGAREFSRVWAKNLRSQGWLTDDARLVKSRDEEPNQPQPDDTSSELPAAVGEALPSEQPSTDAGGAVSAPPNSQSVTPTAVNEAAKSTPSSLSPDNPTEPPVTTSESSEAPEPPGIPPSGSEESAIEPATDITLTMTDAEKFDTIEIRRQEIARRLSEYYADEPGFYGGAPQVDVQVTDGGRVHYNASHFRGEPQRGLTSVSEERAILLTNTWPGEPTADTVVTPKGVHRCNTCWAFVTPGKPCARCEQLAHDMDDVREQFTDTEDALSEAQIQGYVELIQRITANLGNYDLTTEPGRQDLHTDFERGQKELGVWEPVERQHALLKAASPYFNDARKEREVYENEYARAGQPILTSESQSDSGLGDDDRGPLAGTSAQDGATTGSREQTTTSDSESGGRSSRSSGSPGRTGTRPNATGSVDGSAAQRATRERGSRDGGTRRNQPGSGRNPVARRGRDGLNSGIDYTIQEADQIGVGGLKQKYRDNVEAIKLLKRIEAEGRQATPDEQKVLVRFVGWGGMPQVFDVGQTYNWNKNAQWQKEYTELTELLTDKEYEAARRSTTNAHYTSPPVIRAMWEGLDRMGYNNGNVLEPAAGVGHFYGLMPDHMAANTNKVAVELDSISARIATQLYQNADVRQSGYEESNLPKDYFQAIVSNVPFGNFPVHDPEFTGARQPLTKSIHNYYFAKALDHAAPGGVVAFITSHYTMDSTKHTHVRQYLASKADLVGAIRLPNTAFKANANTEVTTDIIFLRKRADGETPGDTSWINTEPMDVPNDEGGTATIHVNEYFHNNPDMMLGKMAATGSMYSNSQPQLEDDGRDLGQSLSQAIQRLPENIAPASQERCVCGAFLPVGGMCNNPKCPTKRDVYTALPETFPSGVREGDYVIHDGRLHRKKGDVLEIIEQDDNTGSTKVERMRGLVAVRDVAREVLRMNLENATDEELTQAQQQLNTAYDQFVERHGPISTRANILAFRNDPDLPYLLSLENYNPKTKTAEKAAIFSERTVRLVQRPESADTAQDAMLISLNETGGVDWNRMSALTGKTAVALQAELEGQIFRTPDNQWVMADDYLSGDVRAKLEVAQAAAKLDPTFAKNVTALQTVQPTALKPSEIYVGFGAGWIPADVMQDFTHHLLKQDVPMRYVPEMGTWYMDTSKMYKDSHQNTSQWGTPHVFAHRLIDDALNGRSTTVTKQISDGQGGTKRVTDDQATLEARDKQAKIKQEFQRWVWESRHSERLANIYNQKFNRIVPRHYNGQHLTFPGMSTEAFELRDYQKAAVWRILQGDNTLLAHIVGSGKSATMIASSMKLKQTGMRNKIVHAVPKNTLQQYAEDFVRLYPGAKVLTVGAAEMTPQKRQTTLNRIATDDWDAVVVSHPAFERIPVSNETYASFIQQEIDKLERHIRELQAEENKYGYSRGRKKDKTVKELEKARERLKTKLKERLQSKKDENALTWDELGVDHLYVDEAHKYKNLFTATKRTRVAGITANAGSKRAMDMFMKTQYLAKRCQCGRFVGETGVCRACGHKTEIASGGVTFATGTPIANSVGELYNMQRYLQREALEEAGLGHFDAWASQFGDMVDGIEMNPTGKGFRQKTRFAKFRNVPEVLRMFSQVADFQMNPDEMGLVRPMLSGASDPDAYAAARQTFLDHAGQDALTDKDKLAPGYEQLEGTDEYEAFARARDDFRKPVAITVDLNEWQETFIEQCARRAENLPADPREDNMLKIVNDARLSSLDPRLVDANLPDNPTGKINRSVEEMLTLYQQFPGKTQMVFLDRGTPGGSQFDLYNDMKGKLIAGGVPTEQIAFIHDATTKAKRLELYQKMNSGELRFLFGSTEKMGVGTNAQRKLIALHHLDAPWRPDEVEQRDGRIVRYGNENPEVRVYRYVTKRSFDVFMWQNLERKAGFIGQITRNDLQTREMEDIDEVAIGFAEIKAAATGDDTIIRLTETEIERRRLESLEKSHRDKTTGIRWRLKRMPQEIAELQEKIEFLEAAEKAIQPMPKDKFAMTVNGASFDKPLDAGETLMDMITKAKVQHKEGDSFTLTNAATIQGVSVDIERVGSTGKTWAVMQAGPKQLAVELGSSAQGNVQRIRNTISNIPKEKAKLQQEVGGLEERIPKMRQMAGQPFEYAHRLTELRETEAELRAKIAELAQGEKKQVVDGLNDFEDAPNAPDDD